MPAHPEVLGDILDGRAFDPRARVVPADLRARRMVIRVEPVAGLGGQVDPADERDAVVDHDRLLVVAMERPLFRIELELDARVAGQLGSHLANVAARRAEERQRRAGPGQHADVDALRELGEQVAKHDGLAVPRAVRSRA